MNRVSITLIAAIILATPSGYAQTGLQDQSISAGQSISVESLISANQSVLADPSVSAERLASISSPMELDAAANPEEPSWGWEYRFDSSADKQNPDLWPDGWKRTERRGFPKYIRAEIAPVRSDVAEFLKPLDQKISIDWAEHWSPRLVKLSEWLQWLPNPSAVVASKLLKNPGKFPPPWIEWVVGSHLRIQLDGGQFEAQSPLHKASPVYQYRIETQVKTEGLEHDRVTLAMMFFDADGQILSSTSTQDVQGTQDWIVVDTPLVTPPPDTANVAVRLRVFRSPDGLEDYRGTVGFGEIQILQLPRLNIATDHPMGIYSRGEPISMIADVLGHVERGAVIEYSVLNQDDQLVAKGNKAVEMDDSVDSMAAAKVTCPLVSAEPFWPTGHYRLATKLVYQGRTRLQAQTTFAVLEPSVELAGSSPIGWTLPLEALRLPPSYLTEAVRKSGTSHVKIPVDVLDNSELAASRYARFVGSLQDSEVETIGMLVAGGKDQLQKPSTSPVPNTIGSNDRPGLAHWFRNEADWEFLVEPLMSRMSTKVRVWQLGRDEDLSFLDQPRLPATIDMIRKGLQGYGQSIEVALVWPWLEPQFDAQQIRWQAEFRTPSIPLDSRSLDETLRVNMDPVGPSGNAPGATTSQWIGLHPTTKGSYSRDQRIEDWMKRLISIIRNRVDKAFVMKTNDREVGLLNPDLHPAEMFLPTRTIAATLGDLRSVGSLSLADGVMSEVFAGAERSAVVLYSPRETTIVDYFGEKARVVDCWGRVERLMGRSIPRPGVVSGSDIIEQTIKVGPIPIVITDCDPILLAFRMGVVVEPETLEARLGQLQKFKVRWTNPTRQTIIGAVQVDAPDNWRMASRRRRWETFAGGDTEQTYEINLNNLTRVGEVEIPIVFDFATPKKQTLKIKRKVDVGSSDLSVQLRTRLLPGGKLRLTMEIKNRSDRQLRLETMAFAATRQYQTRFVTLSPGKTRLDEFHWARGSELIGQEMAVRIVEQDGNQTLNFTVEATR